MQENALYYGDNLEILRRYIDSGSVDLLYLDPPFNSNRDYNVIFRDESGRQSDAQMLAFEDTWHWGPSAEETYAYLTNTAAHRGAVPEPVSAIIGALRKGIKTNQMMAYLVEMTVRLVEAHRVLRDTGWLALHCDPTASAYLKLILDAIFDARNFRNEIVWRRYGAHNDVGQGSRHFGRVHDTLLLYARGPDPKWQQIFVPLDERYIAETYRFTEPDGRRYTTTPLTGPGGAAKGNPVFEFKGHTRAWRYSKETMERLDREGRLYYSRTGYPRQKLYLEDSRGVPVQDVWSDIASLSGAHRERLGYPTQKPLALLERIVQATTEPGDLVLDPFCGCGTALVAAQKLERRWIGIDITYLAIAVMRARLKRSFPELEEIPIIGQPTEVAGARALAEGPNGRYQFQFWALDLIYAEPVGGVEKKGSDRGIDGIITFTDARNEIQSVLVSVKSGHVNPSMIRDLKGTMEREGAAMGVFLTLEEPTKEMRTEAATAGAYHSDLWNRDYPRIQILSIRELLEERKKADLPPFVVSTYKQASRMKGGPASVQPSVWDAPREQA